MSLMSASSLFESLKLMYCFERVDVIHVQKEFIVTVCDNQSTTSTLSVGFSFLSRFWSSLMSSLDINMSSKTLSHNGENHLILEESNTDHKSVLNKLKDGKKCDPQEFKKGDQLYIAY